MFENVKHSSPTTNNRIISLSPALADSQSVIVFKDFAMMASNLNRNSNEMFIFAQDLSSASIQNLAKHCLIFILNSEPASLKSVQINEKKISEIFDFFTSIRD
jgi:hypothetical protein